MVNTHMPVSRTLVDQYPNRLSEFYSCLTKVAYQSRIPATRQAYTLEVKHPDRIYDVYSCDHCGWFHVGRRSARRQAQ